MVAGIACGNLDVNSISNDNIIISEDKAWVRADVEPKIYLYKAPNDKNPRPFVVIKFEEACVATQCSDFADVMPTLAFFSAAVAKAAEQDPNAPNDPPPEGPAVQAKTICGIDPAELLKAQQRLDASSINDRGFQAAAVIPAGAVIPMKSNVKSYGPYASSNFGSSCGGTQVETNTDLCPWVFGSFANMHAAGNSIVENMAIGLVRAETGSVTIPGLPDISNLGATIGNSGPNLTDISFAFGTSGITTTYQFRTYTPKFGGLNRHFLDRFKSAAKNRYQQIKFLRNTMISQNKVNRSIQAFNRTFPANAIQPRHQQASLNRILMGEMYDWQVSSDTQSSISQRTVVGMDTLAKSIVEMRYDFDKKAYMSLDGLFGPVSKLGSGGLPRYCTSWIGQSGHLSSPILPQPPIQINGNCSSGVMYNTYSLDLSQPYFDPLTNKFNSGNHHHSGDGMGHVIDLVGRENDVLKDGMITNFYGLYDSNRYSNDYRFLAMRGPLLLHSWGYDLDGKPIPNEDDSDQYTKVGLFSGVKDRFLKDWLQKPASWPVAPIDLRFDRKRGVWVSPQPYKIVVIKILKEVAPFGTGRGVLVNYGDKLYDKNGVEITTTENACCVASSGCNWIDVVTNVCLTPNGLVIKKQKVRVSDIEGDCCTVTIPTTQCESSSTSVSSSTCDCITENCSSSSSSSCPTESSDIDGLVEVVDRIGRRHKPGCYVYGYFDTSTSKYIVLQN